MKKTIIRLTFLALFAGGCGQTFGQIAEQQEIVITVGKQDTLKFGREEFDSITDSHPELYDGLTGNPDDTWLLREYRDARFGGEAGRDTYYILYAYFLGQRNGMEQYAGHRQKLIDIFTGINEIYGQLRGGGSYFGHQSRRIVAYAEYAIYEYVSREPRRYGINKQKDLYIRSLRQLIRDETDFHADVTITGEEKVRLAGDLNKTVDEIEENITDVFYLRKAQEFQYGYYGYFD